MSSPVLLCDIGNVLVSFDFSRAAARFAEIGPLGKDEVLRVLDPLKGPLESGALMGDSFVEQGMQMIQFPGTKDEFSDIWCGIFSRNEAMEQTLAGLDPKLPKHLLSNTSDLHKEYLLRTFPVFGHFTDGVYSYLAKSMKPERSIFETAIAQLNLAPAQTFYIDDLGPNIETARELGFQAFHYRMDDHASLDSALQQWISGL
jgi:putative hydrolase of the HAD superfamily